MCEHLWDLDPDNPTGAADQSGRRLVHFVCTKCGERLSKLTVRSDRQLVADIQGQAQ